MRIVRDGYPIVMLELNTMYIISGYFCTYRPTRSSLVIRFVRRFEMINDFNCSVHAFNLIDRIAIR